MRRIGAIVLAGLLAAAVGVVSPPAASATPDQWGSSVRLEQRYVTVDGVRTAYAVLGPESPDVAADAERHRLAHVAMGPGAARRPVA